MRVCAPYPNSWSPAQELVHAAERPRAARWQEGEELPWASCLYRGVVRGLCERRRAEACSSMAGFCSLKNLFIIGKTFIILIHNSSSETEYGNGCENFA